MLNNVGEKIQNIAMIMFYAVTVICIILAFALGIVDHGGYYTEFRALPFFGFLILGPLCSYVSTLFLIGFGKIVENIEHMRSLPQIERNVSALADKAKK